MTVSQRVKNILGASRAARNSDIELWLIYAQKSGMDLSDKQIATLKKMPTFETIRRCRQKWQELGQFKADPKIEQARFEKFKQVRQDIPFMGAEAVAFTVDRNGIERDSDGYPIY